MTKYYVKDGFQEKGPFTIREIKKLRLSKFSFVRREDSDLWTQIDLHPEFSKHRTTRVRLAFIALFIFVVGGGLSIFFIAYKPTNLVPEDNFLEETTPQETLIVKDIYNQKVSMAPVEIVFEPTVYKKKLFNEFLKDCNSSGKKSQIMTACNYSNPQVRNKAVSVAGKSPGSFNIGQVCDIYDYCYTNWKYVNDPRGNEIIEYASNTIKNGLNGDCDDFAVLMGAMILAIGGEARINYAQGPEGAHAFTEVNLGQKDFLQIQKYLKERYKKSDISKGVWYKDDLQGNKWLNLDWFASYPGGKYFNHSSGTIYYIMQQYCIDLNK